MKRLCDGVEGSYPFVERVRRGGGGIGSLKSLFSIAEGSFSKLKTLLAERE